ncbi:MAG: phosphatase PAP2 family protein, partial [Candidatus Thiodiazotropha sp.]
LLLVTTLLFVLLTGVVLDGSLTASINQLVYTTLQSLRSPWGDHLMTVFSAPADLDSTLLFTAGLGLALWLRGERRATYYLIAAVLFGLLAPWLLKYSLQIPRPPAAGEPLGPWSFPSAHVLRAATLYGFFSIMLARSLQREWRWLPYSLASLLIGAVTISRLYLGVHWLTDVIGSLMLGIAWVAFLGIAYHRHVEQASRKRLMIGAALLFSALASALAIATHPTRLQTYQAERVIIRVPLQGWPRKLAPELPRLRDDLRGERDQPLNLVLAGNPECLLRHLAKRGWRKAEMLGWHNLLRLLSPSTEIARLPVLPQVHQAAHEYAVFSKDLTDGKRLILRFWLTNIRLTPGEVPLYVGSISGQRADPLLHLLVIPRTEEDFAQPFNLLRDELRPLEQTVSGGSGRLMLDLAGEGSCR